MKKIFSAILVLTMIFSVSGCSLFNGLNNTPEATAETSPASSEDGNVTAETSASPSEAEISASPSEASASDTPSEVPASSGILGDFTADTLDGNTVNQSIFSGFKLTMVNIWATYCGPCINEMPELGVLHRNYAEKGFQVVGLVVDVSDGQTVYQDTADSAWEIIEQTGADYLHILPSVDLFESILNEVMYVPTTIFVDENGNQVGEQYVGAHDYEEWVAIADELLSEVG